MTGEGSSCVFFCLCVSLHADRCPAQTGADRSGRHADRNCALPVLLSFAYLGHDASCLYTILHIMGRHKVCPYYFILASDFFFLTN